MPEFKYVNLTGNTVRISSKSGGRVALRPNEYMTDSWYERYAITPGQRVGGLKVLTKMPIGEKVEVQSIPTISSFHTPPPKTPLAAPPVVTDEQSFACNTTCESSCMTVSEMNPEFITNELNTDLDQLSVEKKDVVALEEETINTDEVSFEDENIKEMFVKNDIPLNTPFEDRGTYVAFGDKKSTKFMSKKPPYPVFTNKKQASNHFNSD